MNSCVGKDPARRVRGEWKAPKKGCGGAANTEKKYPPSLEGRGQGVG